MNSSSLSSSSVSSSSSSSSFSVSFIPSGIASPRKPSFLASVFFSPSLRVSLLLFSLLLSPLLLLLFLHSSSSFFSPLLLQPAMALHSTTASQESPSLPLPMSFDLSTSHLTLLFSSWSTAVSSDEEEEEEKRGGRRRRSSLTFLALCLFSLFAGFLSILLKVLRKNMEVYLHSQEDRKKSFLLFRTFPLYHNLARGCLAFLNFACDYLLMLIVMSFSVWIFLSVLSGISIGFLLFGHHLLSSSSSRSLDLSKVKSRNSKPQDSSSSSSCCNKPGCVCTQGETCSEERKRKKEKGEETRRGWDDRDYLRSHGDVYTPESFFDREEQDEDEEDEEDFLPPPTTVRVSLPSSSSHNNRHTPKRKAT